MSDNIETCQDMIREYVCLHLAGDLTPNENVRKSELECLLLRTRGFLCQFNGYLVDINTDGSCNIFITPLSTIPDLTINGYHCPRDCPIPDDIRKALGQPKQPRNGPDYSTVWKNVHQSHNKLCALGFRPVLNTEEEGRWERDGFQMFLAGNTMTLTKKEP